MDGEIMAEKTVAMLGGDKRELHIVPALKSAGLSVRVFGLPKDKLPGGVKSCATLKEAVRGARLIILPLPGVKDSGLLHAPLVGEVRVEREDLSEVSPGTPVMVGVASNYLRELCRELSLPIFEIAECDSVAVPNAVPTAEGAVQLAMQETEITIDDMHALVLGFGRVGEALAQRLRALGADVTVSNRGAYRFALAAKNGFAIFPWACLADSFPKIDVVFNTVPALVLDKEKLLAMNRDTLIIDLASGAGGTDFAAAEEIGVKAIHALSLPGKVAPISAGRLLGRVYPDLIGRILRGELPCETVGCKTGKLAGNDEREGR
jgi:dipicolinate synthase subunit A